MSKGVRLFSFFPGNRGRCEVVMKKKVGKTLKSRAQKSVRAKVKVLKKKVCVFSGIKVQGKPGKPFKLIPRIRAFSNRSPYSLRIERLRRPIELAISEAESLMNKGDLVKLFVDILDSDRCQRGPSGRPLFCYTPGVPFLTLQEWNDFGQKRV